MIAKKVCCLVTVCAMLLFDIHMREKSTTIFCKGMPNRRKYMLHHRNYPHFVESSIDFHYYPTQFRPQGIYLRFFSEPNTCIGVESVLS